MKITGNSFILSMVETIAEGLTFSEVSGLGVDNTMKFISTMLGGPWEAYAQRMVTGGYMPKNGKRRFQDLVCGSFSQGIDQVSPLMWPIKTVHTLSTSPKTAKSPTR